jgi:signal peptidase II
VKRLSPIAIPFILVIVFDQLTKAWVKSNLWDPPRTIVVVPGWLELTPVANRGVAFGLFQEAGPLLGLVVVAIFAVMGVMNWRRLLDSSPLLKLPMGLIAGGAIGNLIDRAHLGYVVDFITMPRIPIFQVFNVSDAAISVGTVLLVLTVWSPRPQPTPTPASSSTEGADLSSGPSPEPGGVPPR